MKEEKHFCLQMPHMYQIPHLRHSWHWLQIEVHQQTELYWGLAAHGSKLDLHSCQYQEKTHCHFSVMKKQKIPACFPSLCIHEINFPSCPLFFFLDPNCSWQTVAVFTFTRHPVFSAFLFGFSSFLSCDLCCCLRRQICSLVMQSVSGSYT